MAGSSAFRERLRSIVGDDALLSEEPMARHTTFRIGGPAEWFVMPGSAEEAVQIAAACREAETPLRVLGLGSNVLVSDEGVRGVVLCLAARMNGLCVEEGGVVRAQAGATNAAAADLACDCGLAGYEFASGIPGTVGGAAIMNAGAYGGEFGDVATSALCLAPDGTVVEVGADEAGWSYRRSMMGDRGYVVLEVSIRLSEGDVREIRARMDDLARRRAEKQPLELPSAGSSFKRPAGRYAGRLIAEAGLRGFRIGGAQVSEKHAGFIVNIGGATAADVRAVLSAVRDRVRETSGVDLEPEIRCWGF